MRCLMHACPPQTGEDMRHRREDKGIFRSGSTEMRNISLLSPIERIILSCLIVLWSVFYFYLLIVKYAPRSSLGNACYRGHGENEASTQPPADFIKKERRPAYHGIKCFSGRIKMRLCRRSSSF